MRASADRTSLFLVPLLPAGLDLDQHVHQSKECLLGHLSLAPDPHVDEHGRGIQPRCDLDAAELPDDDLEDAADDGAGWTSSQVTNLSERSPVRCRESPLID